MLAPRRESRRGQDRMGPELGVAPRVWSPGSCADLRCRNSWRTTMLQRNRLSSRNNLQMTQPGADALLDIASTLRRGSLDRDRLRRERRDSARPGERACSGGPAPSVVKAVGWHPGHLGGLPLAPPRPQGQGGVLSRPHPSVGLGPAGMRGLGVGAGRDEGVRTQATRPAVYAGPPSLDALGGLRTRWGSGIAHAPRLPGWRMWEAMSRRCGWPVLRGSRFGVRTGPGRRGENGRVRQ